MSDTQTAQPAPPATAPKPIWQSKTIWVNLIALAAGALAKNYGVTLTDQDELYVLGVVNITLRIITKQPVSWSAVQ